MFVALRAQGLEKGLVRHDHAHVARDRFDDNGGDLVTVFGKSLLDGLFVVVGHENGVLGKVLGYARAARGSQGQGTGAGLDQHVVHVAVGNSR